MLEWDHSYSRSQFTLALSGASRYLHIKIRASHVNYSITARGADMNFRNMEKPYIRSSSDFSGKQTLKSNTENLGGANIKSVRNLTQLPGK